ncbi:hypothetical protein HaLaN_28369, partial [Haematococcus lacustris]
MAEEGTHMMGCCSSAGEVTGLVAGLVRMESPAAGTQHAQLQQPQHNF